MGFFSTLSTKSQTFYIRKKRLLCRKARYVRSLAKKTHFWPSQKLKKVLLTEQGCARLRTGLIIMQIPRGYQKKRLLCRKSAILSIRWKKNPFLAFPEAIKANWRSQLHAQSSQMHSIPLGPSEKIPFVQKYKDSAICAILREETPFWGIPRGKKVLLSAQSVCARLRTGPIIMQIPRGYQKKSLLCRKSAILSIRWKFQF